MVEHVRVLSLALLLIGGAGACSVAPLSAEQDATGLAGQGGSGPGGQAGGGIDAAAEADIPGPVDAGNDASSGDIGDIGDGGDGLVVPICASCSSYGAPRALGPTPPALPELSGLAASHLHPGLLYAHNDSGDTARFFAIDEQAQVKAEIHLDGVTAVDWEDISVGPCPAGSCVYIGDTGDNHLERGQYVIYRVPEPVTFPTDGSVLTVTAEAFPFVYPSGPHNAETLLVHPTTGQLFIVIKETGIPAPVWEMPLPLTPDQEVTLTMAGTLAIPPANGVVTDGAFHPCGDRLLIRTTSTTGLFELTRTPDASMATLFGATPVEVPVAVEPQGESVTWALDGRSYFTSSETVSGSPAVSLSQVSCASP